MSVYMATMSASAEVPTLVIELVRGPGSVRKEKLVGPEDSISLPAESIVRVKKVKKST